MNKNLESNIRQLAIPLLSIVSIIVIFFISGNFVVAKINELLLQNEAARKMTSMLNEKRALLQSTQGQVSDFAQSITGALPESNTSLAIASQLRSIAATNSLVLQNFSVGTEVKDGNISHVDVTFDAEGQSANMLSFLNETRTIAPLNKVKRLKITGGSQGGSSRANILISSYWSVFPKEIPAVSDPLQKITPEEQNMLLELSALRQPEFLELAPSAGGKADPFSSL